MHLPAVVFLVLIAVLGTSASGVQAPPPPAQPTAGQATPGQPATPPREAKPNQPPAKGSAVIRGVVLSADDGSPVRRAEVRASSLDGGRGYFGLADAEGRFEVPELPAGRYVLSASKSGYLSPGEPVSTVPRDVRVEVADRQVVEKVQLLLSKGAVITGRIVDDLGDPAMNVTVQALRFAYRDGVRQLSPARGALYSERTDDRGEFRLYGLVPGDYYISAKPANIGGMRQQPLEQGAATTFYPGTQDVVEARRVRAVAGRETGPLAFALGTTRLARVRGFAFGSSGTPLRGTVSIAHRDPFGSGSSSFGGTIRPDGSFEFNSVPPGAYVVTARDVDAYNSTPLEQGSIRITVAGQDIDGLSVFAAKEAVLRGRVVTDDGSPLPSAVQRARLEVVAADPAEGYSGWQNNAVLNEDGTFEVKGLFGRRRLVLGRVLDWQTRETRANGEDVTDTGIEFDSGEVIEDVEIVLTRKVTTVSGAVTDRFGTAVPRATVVLFSENERLWLPNSRFIRTSTTGEKGTYRLTGAPPSNDYLAVAVTGIEDGQWTDPEFLRALKEVGTRVRLKEGESKTLDLKVAERR